MSRKGAHDEEEDIQNEPATFKTYMQENSARMEEMARMMATLTENMNRLMKEREHPTPPVRFPQRLLPIWVGMRERHDEKEEVAENQPRQDNDLTSIKMKVPSFE